MVEKDCQLAADQSFGDFRHKSGLGSVQNGKVKQLYPSVTKTKKCALIKQVSKSTDLTLLFSHLVVTFHFWSVGNHSCLQLWIMSAQSRQQTVCSN